MCRSEGGRAALMDGAPSGHAGSTKIASEPVWLSRIFDDAETRQLVSDGFFDQEYRGEFGPSATPTSPARAASPQ